MRFRSAFFAIIVLAGCAAKDAPCESDDDCVAYSSFQGGRWTNDCAAEGVHRDWFIDNTRYTGYAILHHAFPKSFPFNAKQTIFCNTNSSPHGVCRDQKCGVEYRPASLPTVF